MKLKWCGIIAAVLALQACNSESGDNDHLPPVTTPTAVQNPDAQDEVIATVGPDSIHRKEIDEILVSSYGLNLLVRMAELDIARQEALRQHIIVTPQDIANERKLKFQEMKKSISEVNGLGQPTTEPDSLDLTPAEENELLQRMLATYKITPAEFDMFIEINAYLRKLAEPTVDAHMTDDNLRQEFNSLYGEKVVARYIVVKTREDATEVLKDLSAGKDFEEVARARSSDPAARATGGELPPFTLQDNRFPDEFKAIVFPMKKGDVSDITEIGEKYYIAKLIDRIPPEHAKFEDYKDAVGQQLHDETLRAAMLAMNQRLVTMAGSTMNIQDPLWRQEWDARNAKPDTELHDMTQIRQQLDRDHSAATRAAAAAQAPVAPEAIAPPATMPATAP